MLGFAVFAALVLFLRAIEARKSKTQYNFSWYHDEKPKN
jgi:hypothetical protein